MSISGDGPDNPALEAEIEEMGCPTWTTRDGTVLLISDMTDSHLTNTIKFLRRNVETYRMKAMIEMWAYAENAPDGAADAAMRGADQMDECGDDDDVLHATIPAFPSLLLEAKKRGLEVAE